jgi:hypothetical protein
MKKFKLKDSSKNAFVHGGYSGDLILPGEKLTDFNHLVEGLRDLNPQSTLAEQTVSDIARLQWRKARVNRFAQISLMRTSFVREIEQTGKRSAGAVVRKLESNAEKKAKPNNELQEALSSLQSACKELYESQGVERTIRRKINSLDTEIETLRPLVDAAAAKTEQDKCAADVFEIMEWLTKIEAVLDAEIDRKLKRLVMLNEYDRLYGEHIPKLIEHRASSDEQPPSTSDSPGKAIRDHSKPASENLNDNDWEYSDNDNDDEEPLDDWPDELEEDEKQLKAHKREVAQSKKRANAKPNLRLSRKGRITLA